jgi:endonuclease I
LGRGSYTDLFELYPSDGYVNAIRGNDPLGYVSSGKVMYKSTNECLFGPCDAARNFGHSTGNCFELPDDLKGELGCSII